MVVRVQDAFCDAWCSGDAVPLFVACAHLALCRCGLSLCCPQINTALGFLHGSMVAPWMQALHFFFGLGAFLAPLALGESIAAANGHLWKLGWTHFCYGGLGYDTCFCSKICLQQLGS